MQRPHCCPVCNDVSVQTVLQDYAVTATVKGEDWQVNALAAFQCRNGHVFFLRRDDLVVEETSSTRHPDGPRPPVDFRAV